MAGWFWTTRFLPVFEAAATLGVPVYLHAAPPPEPVKAAYFAGLPDGLDELLSITGWAGTRRQDCIRCG